MGLGVWWNYEHSAAHPQRGRRPVKFFSCEVLQPKPIADADSESISKYRFTQERKLELPFAICARQGCLTVLLGLVSRKALCRVEFASSTLPKDEKKTSYC